MGFFDRFRRGSKEAKAPKRSGRPSRKLASRMPPSPLPPAPSSVIVSRPTEFLDRIFQHPGFGAGPSTLTTIFREAERGWPMRQADLFDDLTENDGHLTSLIQSRTMDVAGKPWQIQAGGDAPEDVAAAEILEEALRSANTSDMMAHQLSGIFYGYAGSEIDWTISSRSGALVPGWFVNVPHRRFRFDSLDRPRLLTEENTTDGLELEPGKWIFSCNTSSGNIARSGLLRTASWWALFKRMCVRDWVIFCEKFGVPLIWGKYDENSHDDDKNALEDAVQDIGEAGQAILSKAQEIEIHHSAKEGSSDSVFGALVSLCNNEMSKLVAGATLLTEANGPGSFALGRVHESRGFNLVLGDALFLSQAFDRFIAQPFIDYNSMNARPPRLKVAVVQNVDPLTRIQIADLMVNKIGLSLDEDQLRQEFQFRKPAGEGVSGQSPASGQPEEPPPLG